MLLLTSASRKKKKHFLSFLPLTKRARSLVRSQRHSNEETPHILDTKSFENLFTCRKRREKKEEREESPLRRREESRASLITFRLQSSSSSLSMQAAPSLAIGANSVEAPDC